MAVADTLGELRFPITASIVATLIVTFLGASYWYATARFPDTVLEEMSIAIERGGADPNVLREAFRGISLTAWSKLQAWVVEQRRRRNAPRLWINVEVLARNWN